MTEKLLTKKEAARYLNISEKELENFVAKGRLSAYKIGGAFVRFKREHLDAVRRKPSARQLRPKDKAGFKKAPPATRPVRTQRFQDIGFSERVLDFVYFHDFYIISFLIVIALLIVIVAF